VARLGHRETGLRVAGSSDALRPLGLAEGKSKGSGSLGARSGTIATRHPQADPGHEPQAPKEPDPKDQRTPTEGVRIPFR